MGNERKPVIVFKAQSQYSDLFGAMARMLRDEAGIASVLVYVGRHRLPDPKVYDVRPDDFVEMVDFNQHIAPRDPSERPSAAELAQRCVEVERRLDCTVGEIIRSDRHLGHDFVTGARYPRSQYSRCEDLDNGIDVVLRIADAMQELYRRYRPMAVIASAGEIVGAVMVAMSQAAGVPLRVPARSYSTKGFVWSDNRYFLPQDLETTYENCLKSLGPSPEDQASTIAVSRTGRSTNVRTGIRNSAKVSTLARTLLRLTRGAIGRKLYRRDVIYGEYLLADQLWSQIERWLEHRRAFGRKSILDDISADMAFVFYPLSLEPESTLMSESPMCDNQLALIDMLAKTVPTGWRVVVKEHPGFVACRPRGFWARAKAYPNVIVAPPFDDGEELASRCRIIATVYSTLGIQGAVAGKPVLTFNPKWFGNLLPQVRCATSYDGVRQALAELADEDRLPPMAERRRAGRALMVAMEGNAVPLTDPHLLKGRAGGQKVAHEQIRAITNLLLSSLPTNGTNVERIAAL